MTTAYDPIDLSGTSLANRIAMAPMTRSRAGEGGAPTDLTVEYYAQRASAGLIITEGIQPSAIGQGYPDTPGLHSAEQIAAWRRVTDAVHAAGGRIFAQLMHAGRIGHPSLLPDGLVNVGASSVPAQGRSTRTGPPRLRRPARAHGRRGPRHRRRVRDRRAGAVEAGFDGVELHGANGYLIHQFLAPGSNHRTDEWGGSVENRIRFAVETVKAVAAEIGAGRTAIRLSPGNPYNDIQEPEPEPTYTALVNELEPLGLAYLHVTEAVEMRELTLATAQAVQRGPRPEPGDRGADRTGVPGPRRGRRRRSRRVRPAVPGQPGPAGPSADRRSVQRPRRGHVLRRGR